MRAFLERVGSDYLRYYRRWIAEQGSWSEAWQDAALLTDRFMRLTPPSSPPSAPSSTS